MRSLLRLDKAVLAVFLVGSLLVLSCATNPDGPGVVNHAPEITGISIGGGKLGIGAGMSISVTAETFDVDGDELDYFWSGDGLFSGGGGTVTWHVPNQYGNLSLSCTVSDSQGEDSYTKSVSVGRRIINTNPGDPDNGEIRWDGSDGAPYYILQGDIVIGADLELVVPGSRTIYCDQGSKLTLLGGARFEGVHYDNQPVLFIPWVANVTSKSYWEGISINSPGKAIMARGLYVRNARHGLSLMLGSSQTLEIIDSKFKSCDKGVEAAQIPVTGEGISFWKCGRGLQATALDELILSHCSFFECDDFGLYLGGTNGLCTRGQFSGGGRAAFIGGGSWMSMTGNAFFISDPEPFISLGDGYGDNPDSLDFRCNYWGEGINSEAEILPRIERVPGSPGLLIEPVSDSAFGSCDALAVPVILGLSIDPSGHPLEGAPGYEGFDFGAAHSDFPAMKLKLSMENEDRIALNYTWSSPDDAFFYFESGVADDGYFDPEGIDYPGQEDRNEYSSLYAVTNESENLMLRVSVRFVMDGEIQEIDWEEALEF